MAEAIDGGQTECPGEFGEGWDTLIFLADQLPGAEVAIILPTGGAINRTRPDPEEDSGSARAIVAAKIDASCWLALSGRSHRCSRGPQDSAAQTRPRIGHAVRSARSSAGM
jgi:hypothetical protein